MQCPNCRFENAEDAQRCSRCGIVLNLSDVDLSDLQPQEPEARPQPRARKKGFACGLAGCVLVGLILAGVFFVAAIIPVFVRARDKARQTSCWANLNQLNLAMLMYAKDHAEVMPPASGWCDLTYPYAKNTVVYVCPAASGAVGTYAMNDAVSRQDLSAIASPEQTVLLFDSTTGWNMHGGPPLIDNRHNGGANFGFADGHSEWVDGRSTSKYTWSVPPPAGSGATGGL